MSGLNNNSIIECLVKDYKQEIKEILERLYPTTQKILDQDLPLLTVEYMIDQYEDEPVATI